MPDVPDERGDGHDEAGGHTAMRRQALCLDCDMIMFEHYVTHGANDTLATYASMTDDHKATPENLAIEKLAKLEGAQMSVWSLSTSLSEVIASQRELFAGHVFTPARTNDRWPVAETAVEYCSNQLAHADRGVVPQEAEGCIQMVKLLLG